MSLKRIYQSEYFETIAFILLYVAVGIYTNPADPLFLNSRVPILIGILSIISLFYGLKNGILSMLIVGVVMYLYYENNWLRYFLAHLFLVLIFAQFYHYWYRKIKKANSEFDYMNNRMKELSNAFYTLKISHDILEKSYTLKPKSIRSTMESIEDIFFKEGSYYESYLNLLEKLYQVQKAVLVIKKDNSFKKVASIGGDSSLKDSDPLVQKAIQTRSTTSVSKDGDNNTKYLSIIPVYDSQKDNLIAIFAIEKMAFLDFNKDNLISISVLTSYLFDQIKQWNYFKSIGKNNYSEEDVFVFEFTRLLNVKKLHDIDSTVIVFEISNELIYHKLKDKASISLRELDKTINVVKDNKYYMLILLPLTSKLAAYETAKKIMQMANVMNDNNKDLHHFLFSVEDKELIQQYING